MRRWAGLLATATLFSGAASGYYHFVRFQTHNGPFVAIPEKFDLSSLPNKTITFYISENGPVQFAPNDSLAGVISQIRAAAQVWNDVPSSELRVAFGGMFSLGTPQTTPGIEVTFDDLPPGLVGLGVPTIKADPATGPNGTFVPIIRSVLILPRDLSERPSFGDRFFMSAVHEFGHTLGLQHTMTSSAMSTEVTRSTTKATPIAADDIAGLSLLYPTPEFLKENGSVSGRVTMGGQGVNLASVVVISPNGWPVSALTNPDGTYRIDGIRPGQYYAYVHPLPPAVGGESTSNNIVYPLDADQRPIPPSGVFEAMFYPATRTPQRVITVSADSVRENLDFEVSPKSSVTIYGVETYSFPAQVDVKPAFLSFGGSRSFIVVRGPGLMSGGAPAPGLTVRAIGSSAIPQRVRAYAPDFLQIDFQLNSFGGEGPRHLIFSREDEVYVLPVGLTVTDRQPPAVKSVTGFTDSRNGRMALVEGTNLSAATRILFDGADGGVLSVDDSGRLVVAPPPAPAGHRAAVVALNPDGQSSSFVHGNSPSFFGYDGTEASSGPVAGRLTLAPSSLPAGIEAMVEITGSGTNFAQGQTRVGFGTSDVLAKRIWVLSPSKLLVNVSIAPTAPLIASIVTVATGLQVVTQPFGFQVQGANSRLPVISSQVMNAATGKPGAHPGATVVASVRNIASVPVSLSLNDVPTMILSMGANQITFQIPTALNPGPAVLRLRSGGESSLPVVIAIDPPPATIAGVLTFSGSSVDSTHPVRPGDLLLLVVHGLAESGSSVPTSTVHVTGGGFEHRVIQVAPSSTQTNAHQILFVLSPQTPVTASVPLTVSIDGRVSAPYLLAVRGS